MTATGTDERRLGHVVVTTPSLHPSRWEDPWAEIAATYTVGSYTPRLHG